MKKPDDDQGHRRGQARSEEHGAQQIDSVVRGAQEVRGAGELELVVEIQRAGVGGQPGADQGGEREEGHQDGTQPETADHSRVPPPSRRRGSTKA